jgi:hypothetical protein
MEALQDAKYELLAAVPDILDFLSRVELEEQYEH